jgi:NADP-dependent 3-hydroxy acid dehydrogenase YdfG
MLNSWAGIGLATAKQAVEQGAYVIIAGRSQDKLEKAQQFLESESVDIHSLNNQNEKELKFFF